MNNISVVSSIDDVKLVKYEKDNTLLYYGVEVSNNDIGINIKFTKDFNEALKIYNKEAYLDYIQKTNDDIIYKCQNAPKSIFGENLDKALIYDDKVIGRRSSLINYFQNELDNIDTKYESNLGLEKGKQKYENKLKNTLKELNSKDLKNDLTPITMQFSSKDKKFHISNEETQLSILENIYTDIVEIKNEIKKEQEESEDNEL